MSADAETLTHLAGAAVCINGRMIQRCAICGAKLADSSETLFVTPEGQAAPPAWPTGGMIQVRVGKPTHYKVLPDSGKLTEDNCLDFA